MEVYQKVRAEDEVQPSTSSILYNNLILLIIVKAYYIPVVLSRAIADCERRPLRYADTIQSWKCIEVVITARTRNAVVG